MKKIIVTGGCGFIGSQIIKFLLKKKYKILVLDKLSYASNLSLFKLKKKYLHFKKIDISNEDKLIRILKKFQPDFIINCAAETHVDRSINDPDRFIKSNIIGTYNILEYLKKNIKCRLVHVSTDEVFGSLKLNNLKFNENSKYNPMSPYSASKAASDHLVRAYGNTYNIDYIITNCSNNYGPYQHPEKFIPTVINSCIKKKKIPIYGNGKNIREWIHVEDHSRAVILCMEKGKKQETYLIGSKNEYTNLEIARKICLYFNKINKDKFNYFSLISFVKDRQGHDFRYAINYNKIIKNLKFKNKIRFSRGLSKTIDFYIQNKNKLNKIFKKV